MKKKNPIDELVRAIGTLIVDSTANGPVVVLSHTDYKRTLVKGERLHNREDVLYINVQAFAGMYGVQLLKDNVHPMKKARKK